MSLSNSLTLSAVRSLADDKTFQRGLAYFHEGAVGRLETEPDEVRTVVQGTYRYRVMLAAGEEDCLEYDCDCPVGDEGVFCKHTVALALAWLENSGAEVFQAPEPGTPKRKRSSKTEQIRNYLETLTENALRDLLVEATERDRHLREQLLFAAKASAGSDVPSLRAAVRQATSISGSVDWREAGSYADRIHELATLLEKRIGDGNPKLVELIEEAINKAENALQQIDDSNGEIYPAIERLQEVHCLACARLHPDPVGLAARLFLYQMEGEWDTFHNILPAYLDAFGSRGLAHYRQLVEQRWEALPVLRPSDQHNSPWDSRRFRVEHAMEALAKLEGNVDAIAAIKMKDLSSSRRFLDLAALYRDQEQFDDALAWAEKGIAAFPGERIHDLLSFAIDEYARRGDKDKVETLAWDRFQRQMGSEAFFRLLEIASRIDRQDVLRPKALEALWDQVRKEEGQQLGQKRPTWQHSAARSQLVEIFLIEKDSEQAWSALKGGPTDMRLWDKAAALRGKTHPDEAIHLYFQLLPHHIQAGTRNARYEAAVETVKAIRQLRLAQGEKASFRRELEDIRAQYKAKRNFIKALADLD